MKRVSGYHVVELDDVRSGDHYFYHFADGPARPDPASRFQPAGVHGPSQVISSEYAWTDIDWSGVRREDLVLYELHVGTFTDEGTFSAAEQRLDELVDLGITGIEMMPLADAAGRWNWGYDGVCLFAPNRNYGTPEELRRFVDSAHAKGLAVILDVVYNHLGPEGNYLGESGPYLSEKHHTVWGAGPNFDDPVYGNELRRFFIANAIHWYHEYHIDGLRVDAIHCMKDESEIHVAAEMSQAVKEWAFQSARPAMLIAESNVYDPVMLTPLEKGGIGFDALWCDDFLHSAFAVVRPGVQVCHRAYNRNTDLDQTLHLGYVYEGTLDGERGRQIPESRVDTRGLIYSIQHHDFIGNHPLGQRLKQLTSSETQRAAAALLILTPAIPMLFMGEEFACERPFQFFVDFTDDHLRRAVVEGRKREYPQHEWSEGTLPTNPNAFFDSKIGSSAEGDLEMRAWYRSLIRLRKQWRADGLLWDRNLTVHNDLQQGLFSLRYCKGETTVTVAVRLSADPDEKSVYELKKNPGTLVLDSRHAAAVTARLSATELQANHAKVFVSGPSSVPDGISVAI